MGWRAATAVVWAGVVVSGWYWTQVGLATAGRPMIDAPSVLGAPEILRPLELARLLGAAAPVASGPGPGPADRFILSGVIASLVGKGAALISVDGKPARPFEVGAELAPGYVLVSVAQREAMLAEGLFAPVRAVLALPLPREGESPLMPSAVAAAVPVTPGISSAATTGPSVAPGASAPAPPPVPARADSRRQPQRSLQRDERHTP